MPMAWDATTLVWWHCDVAGSIREEVNAVLKTKVILMNSGCNVQMPSKKRPNRGAFYLTR